MIQVIRLPQMNLWLPLPDDCHRLISWYLVLPTQDLLAERCSPILAVAAPNYEAKILYFVANPHGFHLVGAA